jgi:hypothetical protein
MSADTTFLAFERHLKRATGESVVTIEAAYDPWENEIDLMDQRLGFTKPTDDDDADLISQRAANGFREFFQYCFDGVFLEPDGVQFQLAIRRFCSVAHHMFPSMLRVPPPGHVGTGHGRKGSRRKVGPPITLADLAKQARSTPKTMEKMAKNFMDRWESCAD